MHRSVRVSGTYALCLLAGIAVGMGQVSPEAQMSSAETVVVQGAPKPSVPAASLVQPAQTKPAGPKVSDIPPMAGTQAEIKDWIRKCYVNGQPDLAMAAFLKIPSLEIRQFIAFAFANESKNIDPHFVGRMILSLPAGGFSDQAFARLINDWTTIDADEALQFMETVPVERFNDVVLDYAVFGLCQLPAERVAAFVNKLGGKERAWFLETAMITRDQTGSSRNAQRIKELVSPTPAEEIVSRFVVDTEVTEAEPRLVEQWITEETDPVRRDRLISGYARSKTKQPEAALRWAAQIRDTDKKQSEQGWHLRQWLESDRAAALAWLQGREGRELVQTELRASLLRSYRLEAAP